MRTRRHIAEALCAILLAAGGLAWDYEWTGDVNSDWNNADNWKESGLEGYPDDTGDDAKFPESARRYDVNLITEEIDDLSIFNSYNFTASSGSPMLEVDSLSISTADVEDTVVVTISGATIVTAAN